MSDITAIYGYHVKSPVGTLRYPIFHTIIIRSLRDFSLLIKRDRFFRIAACPAAAVFYLGRPEVTEYGEMRLAPYFATQGFGQLYTAAQGYHIDVFRGAAQHYIAYEAAYYKAFSAYLVGNRAYEREDGMRQIFAPIGSI